MDDAEVVLGGGSTHTGEVVRIGREVHRPRSAGADLVEAFLLHLEQVGFDAAPRFLGVDDAGRQVLTFVEGDATSEPTWLRDDDANRSHLVDVARLLRRLHEAGHDFVAPAGVTSRRPCPAPGSTWLHGDVHYGNLVYRGDRPVALLDWDFATRGDALYDVVTLLFSSRCPRPDRPAEYRERADAARETLDVLLAAYGAGPDERRRPTRVAGAMCAGAAEYLLHVG
ncbi:MAG: aminoglycoside phosphotransferase family protein, partial [Ilumatobacter sp.]|uniref:aminoglycoside phosphotransferase family protein n=1 Tax=Ilumatobacter sp. TaxID=1967498 RepID=UPI0032987C41